MTQKERSLTPPRLEAKSDDKSTAPALQKHGTCFTKARHLLSVACNVRCSGPIERQDTRAHSCAREGIARRSTRRNGAFLAPHGLLAGGDVGGGTIFPNTGSPSEEEEDTVDVLASCVEYKSHTKHARLQTNCTASTTTMPTTAPATGTQGNSPPATQHPALEPCLQMPLLSEQRNPTSSSPPSVSSSAASRPASAPPAPSDLVLPTITVCP